MKEFFRRAATRVSLAAGTPGIFFLAFLVILTWAVVGPIYDFSNTWQLVINTATTITTFLMVFLIQNTQNRESRATQLKLDEIIRATRARDSFVDLEELSDDDIEYLTEEFRKLHELHPHPGLQKLHTSLQRAHHARRSNASRVVGVVNVLNPFGDHDKK